MKKALIGVLIGIILIVLVVALIEGKDTEERTGATTIDIVTSLDKANKTPEGAAQYYMYCILRGDYDKAWNMTYKPEELVFSEKLLRLKYEEAGVSTAEETTLPLGYSRGVNKIYNEDGQLVDKDGNIIVEEEATSEDKQAEEEQEEKEKSDEPIEGDKWGSYNEAQYAKDTKYIKYGDFTYKADIAEIAESIMNENEEWVTPYRTGIFMYGSAVTDINEKGKVPEITVNVQYGYDNAGYNVYSRDVILRGTEKTGYEVFTPKEFLNKETVKIKVSDGVGIKINGAKVSSALCGTDDYYVLTQYPNYSQIDVELSCIPLKSLTKKLDIIDTATMTQDKEEYWNLISDDGELNKYELRWELSKNEILSAQKWLNSALPKVLDAIVRGNDIKVEKFGGTLWSKADKESFKPQYMKAVENLKDTNSYDVKSLALMSCEVDRTIDKEYTDGFVNEVIDKNSVNLHVVGEASLVKRAKDNTEDSSYTMELEFDVQLTKEKGKWKFVSIPKELLDDLQG